MPSDPTGADLRRSPRVGAPKVVVRIPNADRFRSHYLKDLSEGGLFIKADRIFAIGTELAIELWPPGETVPLYLPSRVTRAVEKVAASATQPAGMAVAFINPPPDTQQRLSLLIDLHGEALPSAPLPVTSPAPSSSVAHHEGPDSLGQVQTLLFELEEARALNTRLQNGLNAARQELAVAQKDLAASGRDLASARSELSGAEKDAAAARTEASLARAGQQKLQAEEAQARTVAKQQADLRAGLEQELQALRSEIKELKAEAEIDRHSDELTELRAQVEQLGWELDSARARERDLSKVLSGATLAGQRPRPPGEPRSPFQEVTRVAPRPQARAPQAPIPLAEDEEIVVEVSPAAGPAGRAPRQVSESVDEAFDALVDESDEPPSPAPASGDGRAPFEVVDGDEPLFGAVDLDFGDPAPGEAKPKAARGATASAPNADALDAFLSEEPTDGHKSIPQPRPATGGVAGFVLKDSIAPGRVGYSEFATMLTFKTRLLPSEALNRRKPNSVDEALIGELLAASPTFGTLLGQVGGQMKEERLKQLIFELYARALVDLREY